MGGATGVLQKAKESIPVKTIAAEGFRDRMQEVFDAVSRRAFEIFESNGRSFGHDIEDWFRAENELFEPVHTDITESDWVISVKAEVPGFTERELQVAIEPSRLAISGKHTSSKGEKKGKALHSEICSKEVFRVIDLPTEVETGKVTATLTNGILQLTIPKAAKGQHGAQALSQAAS